MGLRSWFVDDVSYRTLFDQSPVATFFEDFSAVAAWMHQRRADGVEDLRPLLDEWIRGAAQEEPAVRIAT